jgi:hypothetical protein
MEANLNLINLKIISLFANAVEPNRRCLQGYYIKAVQNADGAWRKVMVPYMFDCNSRGCSTSSSYVGEPRR